MDNTNQVFIQSKGKIAWNRTSGIFVKDLISIIAEEKYKGEIEELQFEFKEDSVKDSHLISMLSIIALIKNKFPSLIITVLGEPEILVNFSDVGSKADRFKPLRLTIVTFLLFIGSITAIINFHADVDMRSAHQTLYHLITGIEEERPLLLQIPYSLGIGVGMSVFFNHIFKKRINNEPSPLEVEMYLYQQNMDSFIKDHSNEDKTEGI